MLNKPDSLCKLLSEMRVKQVPRGQILLYEGDEPGKVFVIKSGIIKIYSIDENGNEKILHILSESAIFPFVFFSGNQSKTQWFYSALTDCDIYVTQPDIMQSLMERDPAVSQYMLNWFSQEVHELLARLSSLGKTTVQDKLSAALKFLAIRHSVKRRSGWSRVQFPVNHQLLADMIGMTRESTSTAMKELADKKLIRNPRLTILEINIDKLIEEN